MVRKILTKALAVIVVLAGTVATFFAVRTRYTSLISGFIIAFVLISLFIWNIVSAEKKNQKIAAKIIWIVGAISGFLIGFRPSISLGPEPWKWLPEAYGYLAVMVNMHIDWKLAVISWTLFLILGIILWTMKIRNPRVNVSRK